MRSDAQLEVLAWASERQPEQLPGMQDVKLGRILKF
jgi:hypothetical protein